MPKLIKRNKAVLIGAAGASNNELGIDYPRQPDGEKSGLSAAEMLAAAGGVKRRLLGLTLAGSIIDERVCVIVRNPLNW